MSLLATCDMGVFSLNVRKDRVRFLTVLRLCNPSKMQCKQKEVYRINLLVPVKMRNEGGALSEALYVLRFTLLGGRRVNSHH